MRYGPALALCGLLCTGALLLPHTGLAQNDPVYVVENGRVDQHTYNGYRRYGESCHRCHGPDGAGSSYAPDLTQSLKTMSYEQFTEVVINGRTNVTQAQNNVMPAFGTVEDVALYLDDIYGYLKARSDGKLPRGRPKRVGEED
ncbi:MAG: c-type cytochrome [Acetobacteraceae bacterium]|nr:c-type cytochrome [Acetobacteraceae bacterium]